MAANNEVLACVYAALILQDGEKPVTADKMQTLLKETKVDVEPYWPGMFAKAVGSLNLKDLVSDVGAGTGAPAAAATGAADAPAAAEKKEEKKEEEEEEEDDGDMGFGLFD